MDIIVGQKAHRELTVTEQMVQAYAEISGDYNPLHFDLAFTSRTRFEKFIAQGGITTGYCMHWWRWICPDQAPFS